MKDKLLEAYYARHGVQSAPTLTVCDDGQAAAIAEHLAPRIAGKTVVEIGGGTGLLALHMGTIAERVFCIEANPVWASHFVSTLLHRKPPNVSYLFGTASEFVDLIKADIAVICTHSGLQAMVAVAAQFARVVVDVYAELATVNGSVADPIRVRSPREAARHRLLAGQSALPNQNAVLRLEEVKLANARRTPGDRESAGGRQG